MFAQNIKKIIKKKGYKLGVFAPKYLNMSSTTFGHQLKHDNLKSGTIEKLLKVLNISFEDVMLMNVEHSNTDISKPVVSIESVAKPEGAEPWVEAVKTKGNSSHRDFLKSIC